MTLTAWNASFVRRWHTHPTLCDTLDYDSGHQQRVALLVLLLKPEASRELIVAAIIHDQGEFAVGDIPSSAKLAHPDLKTIADTIERKAIHDSGLPSIMVTPDEALFLSVCDYLDCYLWMLRYRPKLRFSGDWKRQINSVLERAELVGVHNEVVALLNEAERFYA